MCHQNPYVPKLATITEVIDETPDTKTFRARFVQGADDPFPYEPGQFQEASVFGVGESTFCLTSTPTRPGHIEFSVKRVGMVTSALHEMEPGATVGIRAPLGNWFPYAEWKGRNLLFIGGGIGMAPLRSLLNFCLDTRDNYAHVDVIYGARSPEDLCFTYEFDDWKGAPDTSLYLTVDREAPNWDGHVGFVPAYLKELSPSPVNTIAITCGPPIMIKFVLQELKALGFTPEQIYTTLEMRMKCGVGKCGRCNIGSIYVCTDGPVFSLAQLDQLPPEF